MHGGEGSAAGHCVCRPLQFQDTNQRRQNSEKRVSKNCRENRSKPSILAGPAAPLARERERERDAMTDVALLEVPPPRHAAPPARQHLRAACDV